MQRMSRHKLFLALAALVLAVPGCTVFGHSWGTGLFGGPGEGSGERDRPNQAERALRRAQAQAARSRANELGLVPVIMYHRVIPNPVSPYDTSPTAFRKELRKLYRQGYRPVRAIDLVTGRIDLPAGKSPVVLTFDDSSPSQFGYRAGTWPDRRTAVGILLDFAKRHPGFEPIASMYVNGSPPPFASAQGMDMLRDLHRRGFELGNHTLHHADLSRMDGASVRRELVLGRRLILEAAPKAEVKTVALPYGRWPRRKKLAYKGRWGRGSYEHEGVLLAGYRPAPSPFSRSFDPLAIPRIASKSYVGARTDMGSSFWLRRLARHPEKRYVADGDPRFVSFPRRARHLLRPGLRDEAATYRVPKQKREHKRRREEESRRDGKARRDGKERRDRKRDDESKRRRR